MLTRTDVKRIVSLLRKRDRVEEKRQDRIRRFGATEPAAPHALFKRRRAEEIAAIDVLLNELGVQP